MRPSPPSRSNTAKWTAHNARRGGPAPAAVAPHADERRPVRRRTRTSGMSATRAVEAAAPAELQAHALGDTVTIRMLEGVVGVGNAGDILTVTETVAIELIEARGYAVPYTGSIVGTPLYQTLWTGPQTLSTVEIAQVIANLGGLNGVGTGGGGGSGGGGTADVVATVQPSGAVLFTGTGVIVEPSGALLLTGSNVPTSNNGGLLVTGGSSSGGGGTGVGEDDQARTAAANALAAANTAETDAQTAIANAATAQAAATAATNSAIDATTAATGASAAAATASAAVAALPVVTLDGSTETVIDGSGAILPIRNFLRGLQGTTFITGRFYPGLTAGAAFTISDSVAYFMPFPVHRTWPFDMIGCNPSTTGTGALLRYAIFRDNGSGYPGLLLAEKVMSAAISATGGQGVTFDTLQTLTPDLYWLAVVSHSGSAQPQLIGASAVISQAVIGGSNFGANASGLGYTLSGVTGTFAGQGASLPAGAVLAASVPYIQVRAA